MRYFANKGLFIRAIGNSKYVIEDVFGNCSLPIYSELENLDEKTLEIANIHKLVSDAIDSEFPDLSELGGHEVDYYFNSHINYSFSRFLLAADKLNEYNSKIYIMPIAYTEFGYGDGSKSAFETIHSNILKISKEKDAPFSSEDLTIFLVTQQVQRICSDIMSFLLRTITAYTDLLRVQRLSIMEASGAIEQLNSPEIIHKGKFSYAASTAVTSLVISLCSSLDLAAKFVLYLNSINCDALEFKIAKSKNYSELRKTKPNYLPKSTIDKLIAVYADIEDLTALIQFRNDVIHSTSSIELQRLYIGRETAEVNNMYLFYGCQYWRDCEDNGQPSRYLGRDYFTDGKVDIEVKLLLWIKSVFMAHEQAGKIIHDYFSENKKI